MLGPIFSLEMLLGSRRGRSRYLRWFVGSIVAIQLLAFALSYQSRMEEERVQNGFVQTNVTAQVATEFVLWLAEQQYYLILLATPAFVAGAITDEKTRGTLLYLFSAELSSWEILVGKLLGRCFEVFVLLLATLPVMAFVGVWAGVSLWGLVCQVLGCLGPLLAIGSAGLLMSVWCRQTRDAVIGLYAIGGLLLLLRGLITWLGGLTPAAAGLRRLAEYFSATHILKAAIVAEPPHAMLEYLAGVWLAWGLIGLPCFAVAVWRLRTAFSKQLEHRPRAGWFARLLPRRAPVHDEPLLWKERHVDGIAPLAVFQPIPRWFALPGVAALTVVLAVVLIAERTSRPVGSVLEWILTFNSTALTALPADALVEAFVTWGLVVLVVASLVVGIRCSGAISHEREQQTWEALLLTPLDTKQLVRFKLWGILGAAAPYVLAYSVPSVWLATIASPPTAWLVTLPAFTMAAILALAFRRRLDSFATFWVFFVIVLGSMLLSLAVGAATLFLVCLMILVTTLAMFYMGAAGIWCSARFANSWHSLAATMGLGYVGGLILWVVFVPITIMVGVFLFMLLSLLAEADLFLGTQAAATLKGLIGPGSAFVIGVIASGIVLAAVFLGVPWLLIVHAERYVAERDRIRVWRPSELPEPIRRTRRYRQLKNPPTANRPAVSPVVSPH